MVDVIHTNRRWLYDLYIFYDGYMMLFYTQGVLDLNDQTSPICSMSKSKLKTLYKHRPANI